MNEEKVLKVLIDILTPKQVMFFLELKKELKKRNIEVILLTRAYREVNDLLKRKKENVIVIGRHGGNVLSEKLLASTERIRDLIPIFIKTKPDICISFSSPECSRVSYGLGIPHICISDSPHAVAVSKLSIPLSEKLISPKMIHKDNWTRYGINKEKIVQYNALDPWVWLKDFNPDYKILDKIGLNENHPIVTIRLAEEYASYLLGNKSEKNISMEKLAKKLTSENKDIQVVIIPRYLNQIEKFKEIQNNKIIIMDSIVDGPSLLYYSNVFIGAGGTMSAEAALLGIPTFSCFPGKSYIIEQYLIEKGLIKRVTNIEILVTKIHNILKKSKEIRRKNEKKAYCIVKEYDDPIKIISDEIEHSSLHLKNKYISTI